VAASCIPARRSWRDGTEFEYLRPQLQNLVLVRVIAHGRCPDFLAADDIAAQRPVPFLLRPIILLQPLLNGWAAIIAACDPPLLQKVDHFPAQSHQRERGLRAIQVVVDLVPNGSLKVQHFSP
jgi:hypothetical protein